MSGAGATVAPNGGAVRAAEPRAPYMLRRAIGAVKEAVPVEAYAATLTNLRPSGSSLRGRCPIHKGDNEGAFLGDPDSRRWHCFRCDEGGDVIDLARAVEGGELWEAVVSLAHRYNVELPRRPRSWHERQSEKARVREAATRHIAARYQAKLTHLYSPLVLVDGQTPDERMKELEELARALWPAALAMAARRVNDEG